MARAVGDMAAQAAGVQGRVVEAEQGLERLQRQATDDVVHRVCSIGNGHRIAPCGGARYPILAGASRRQGIARKARSYAAKRAFIFLRALASTWRMRSALTPYSSASSCSVTLFSSSSQRRRTMSRERASSDK